MKIRLTILLCFVLILGACGTSENETDQTMDADEGVQVELNEDKTNGPPQDEDKAEALIEPTFKYDSEEVNLFELQIELLSNEEWSYEFNRSNQKAKIEHENGAESEKSGEEVFSEIEELLTSIQIDHERSINDMINQILDYLNISRDDLKEIDVYIETSTGKILGFEYQAPSGSETTTINEFDLEIRFVSNGKWDYEYDLREQEFKIEYHNRDNLNGQDAQKEVERIISAVNIDLDQSIGSLRESLLSAIDADASNVDAWEFEVEYEDQMRIGVKSN